MNIISLYKDFSIPYATEDHKHSREGWINIECPFCTGNPGYHLGYNTDEDYYHCWRCGGKSTEYVIAKLLSISFDKAKEIIEDYGGISIKKLTVRTPKVNLKPFKFPSGELSLTKSHIKYLEHRNFDPDKLISEWGIMGTGPVARLDNVDYSHRILAPISWEDKVVSFQTRTIKKKITKDYPKYLACPQAREMIEHQTILYGDPQGWDSRGICVEGITDVWRLGKFSFAVFGIDYTPAQVRWISKIFKEVIVLFDAEEQAQRQAKKLVAELNFRGIKSWRYLLDTKGIDPANLSQTEADNLKKELVGVK